MSASARASSSPSITHKLSQQDHSLSSVGMPDMAPEFISILIRVRYFLRQNNDTQVMVDDYEQMTTLHVQLFNDIEAVRFSLAQPLHRLGVPEDYRNEHLIQEISNFGKMMVADARNADYMILQMGVDIEIVTGQCPNEDEEAAMTRAVTRREWNEPSYLNDMENFIVKTEDLCLIPDCCAICREKPSVGVRFSQLSCSHMFHWSCIFSWLLRSNQCPMCRHPLQRR